MKLSLRWVAAAAFASVPLSATAGAYPDRPIRMVVGFTPAGGADLTARVVAKSLEEKLGTTIVIDNRPGAGSLIATTLVAKSPADGYTLLCATSSLAINPNLYARAPYDAVKDFVPISRVASSPDLIVVQPSYPAGTMQELLALARAKPNQLNYSTGGNGSLGHLAGELLKSMARVQVQHVPYKGLAPALTDLVGGRVDFTVSSLASASALLKGGKLRVLAVTSAKRSSFMPEIPTVAESGVPGYDVVQWFAVVAPAGTPRAIVSRLSAALESFLAKPDAVVVDRFAALGSSPLFDSPEEFQAYIRTSVALWQKVVRQANLKVK